MATQKEIAEYLDLSAPYVSTLVKNGVLPQAKGKEGMNKDHCRIAYINYLRSKARMHLKSGSGDIGEEKLRLVKNQADHKELEVAELSGKLIDTDDVIDLWQDMIANCRSKLLNIAAKVTHQVIGMTEYGEVEDLINDEIHEALNELAKEPIPETTEINLEQVDSDIQSTREVEGQSMVGQIQSSD